MLPFTITEPPKQSDKPVCVFLHGWMGSQQDWQPITKRMESQYTGVLVDLPGHGENAPIPVSTSLYFENVVCSLYTQLQPFPPFVLIGYSMGGRLALYYALRYPETVQALVLESCQPGIQDPIQREKRAQQDAQHAEQMTRDGLDAFVDRWYEAPLFQSLHQHTELLEGLKKKRKENDAASVAKVMRDLSPGRQPSLWQDLSSLSLPVLLLTGELDPKYPALMQRMHELIPNSILKIASGVGHNVHLENPKQWIEAVQDFLGSFIQ